MKKAVTFLITLACTASLVKGQDSNDLEKASAYFRAVKEICDRDGGKLWGRNVYSPTLFIDREHNIIANEPLEGFLTTTDHGVSTGKFPEDMNIANSITAFGDKKWTMVMWPLPQDPTVRNVLIIHEMFHYRQDELGLGAPSYSNDHMEKTDARILMKMEWSALATAMNATGEDEMKQAVSDALAFRNTRRTKYEGANVNENRFEVHEGMPEYTGRKLVCESDAELVRLATGHLDPLSDAPMVRTFGYTSGPMYGYLLDKTGAQWRERLTFDSDLGEMLAGALGLNCGIDNFETVEARYGYEAVRDFEEGLAVQQEAVMAQYRAKLVNGPLLRIPMDDVSISFDPNTVYSLGDDGTVYETIRLVTAAGILEVNGGGCLISPTWSTAYVSAEGIETDGNLLKGEQWTLKLTNSATVETEAGNIILRSGR